MLRPEVKKLWLRLRFRLWLPGRWCQDKKYISEPNVVIFGTVSSKLITTSVTFTYLLTILFKWNAIYTQNWWWRRQRRN